MTKKRKAKPRKRSTLRDLTASNAKAVKGGAILTARKSGEGQKDFG
jgi:hypothetical protein